MTAEPWVPEPAPQGPGFEERQVPLCPRCRCLCRRTLMPRDRLTGLRQDGPWRCDLHGEVTPRWEWYEIPTGYEEATT